METTKRENQVPMLWYWSVPENGMDIEDCEMIAKENLVNCQINRYRDMHALKRGGNSVNIAIEELNECITDGKTVEKDMEYKLLTESIEDFLWKQTKRNRTVFLKRYFYVMDIKEIAEELDIKEGTVKSILSRMRKELAVWLEKEAVV